MEASTYCGAGAYSFVRKPEKNAGDSVDSRFDVIGILRRRARFQTLNALAARNRRYADGRAGYPISTGQKKRADPVKDRPVRII